MLHADSDSTAGKKQILILGINYINSFSNSYIQVRSKICKMICKMIELFELVKTRIYKKNCENLSI